jgi:hypothetical protein
VRGKEVGLAVEDDVEPPIAAEPSEKALHHPADATRQKASVPGSARRDRDVDVVLERRCGERFSLEPAIAEQITLKAKRGQSRQRWQAACTVVHIGRLQFEVKQRAMLDGVDAPDGNCMPEWGC